MLNFALLLHVNISHGGISSFICSIPLFRNNLLNSTKTPSRPKFMKVNRIIAELITILI